MTTSACCLAAFANGPSGGNLPVLQSNGRPPNVGAEGPILPFPHRIFMAAKFADVPFYETALKDTDQRPWPSRRR